MSIKMHIKSFWHWQIEQRWVMSRFNRNAILPGDLYENCNYHPMACIENNYGELTGVSLVDGRIGSCSAFHCGPVKYRNLKEARLAASKMEGYNGQEF